MKKIYQYIGAMLLTTTLALGNTACSPLDFATPDENGIPVLSEYESGIHVEVDQETNYAYFYFDAMPGVTPIWIMDGKTYSSSFSFSKYYRKAGDYSIEVKIANANGTSDGTLTKTFHVDKTQMTGFGGFDYDSEFNMWRMATIETPAFWYAPEWNQVADPVYTFSKGAYTLTLPSATTETWQAQMMLPTDISTAAGKNYDFSVILTSSTEHPHVMVKLVDSANDDVFYCAETVALAANEPLCFWKYDMPGLDIASLKLVLDFGGNAENTEITVENIVLKDHANNDGTVVPDVPKEPEPAWSAVDSKDNLWNSAAFTTSFFYADANWGARPNPVMTIDGASYSISFPDATAAQWQNQVLFNTVLTADTETEYDFRIVLNASQDVKGATIKLVQTNETDADGNEVKHDENFFFVDNVDLTAEADIVCWKSKLKAPQAMHAISLVLDFGGNPAGTDIVIKDIIFQKHKE